MRRLNLQSVARTAIALLVFGALVTLGCNEPATRATTATDAAADQTTPAQVAVTTGSGPEVDSSPATEPTAKVTTAKNPTAEQQPPVQPVKTTNPGPTNDSVPADGQPVQVATVLAPPLPDAEHASITIDSGPEGDSLPPADPPRSDHDLAGFRPARRGPGPSRRNHDVGSRGRPRSVDRPSRPDRNRAHRPSRPERPRAVRHNHRHRDQGHRQGHWVLAGPDLHLEGRRQNIVCAASGRSRRSEERRRLVWRHRRRQRRRRKHREERVRCTGQEQRPTRLPGPSPAR